MGIVLERERHATHSRSVDAHAGSYSLRGGRLRWPVGCDFKPRLSLGLLRPILPKPRAAADPWWLYSMVVYTLTCRALLLGGHLRVAIAPGAQLQAAADPAQTFVRIGGALFCAHYASARLLEAVGFDRQPGLLQKNLRNNCVREGRWDRGRQSFPFHDPNITGFDHDGFQGSCTTIVFSHVENRFLV